MFGSIALGFDYDSSESDDESDNRLSHRNLRDATNVLELPDERFLANYRVSKALFLRLLEEVGPKMKEGYRSTHIPCIYRLATFLTFIGTGGYQKTIGSKSGASMSKSQVSRVISECLDIFHKDLCSKWITLNRKIEVKFTTKTEFYKTAGMPGVIGCVDGTHVRIKAPSDDVRELYNNPKGFCSIKVMAICDHNMTITFVDATQPGSTPHATIWDNSLANDYFKSNFMNGKTNTFLLGDSRFKLQPYMMTPYRNPNDEWQKKFNECHSRTLNIIERCFHVLKNRFRCIMGLKGLHYTPQQTAKIVNTCCALHNICIFYKNDWLPSDTVSNFDEEETTELPLEEERTAACAIRDEIARNLS